MATLSTAEQRGAVDGIFRACGENYNEAAVILNYLKTVLPAFTWEAQLRTRAAVWQPFVASGLSIDWWCDEVIRLATILANQ